MVEIFDPSAIRRLYKPDPKSSGEDNGQVTIIGGSDLFHGAPILSLKVASRIVDMVFFATPEKSVGQIAENIKSKLMSFIWVPWDDVEKYIEKSDSVLIGPGFKRFASEKVPSEERFGRFDESAQISRRITENLLTKFPDKKWVIDAGSLQVMDTQWIPKGAILTPNQKEYNLLFGDMEVKEASDKYRCAITLKRPESLVCFMNECVKVKNGNPGLTKGGTGDVLAGLSAALLAKNEPFLAAAAASYIVKKAADDLYKKVGTGYNSNDLADEIPRTFNSLL